MQHRFNINRLLYTPWAPKTYILRGFLMVNNLVFRWPKSLYCIFPWVFWGGKHAWCSVSSCYTHQAIEELPSSAELIDVRNAIVNSFCDLFTNHHSSGTSEGWDATPPKCPRGFLTWMSCWKLGSKVRISGLVMIPIYTSFISRWNNPSILIIDPNFLGHRSTF